MPDPEAATAPPRAPPQGMSLLALLLWFFFNSTTVISNKFVFQTLQFTFPITLTLVHMATCALLSFVVLRVLRLHPYDAEYTGGFSAVAPLGALFSCNIVLGNLSLKYVPVSFMQTVKSTVPAFTVLIQTVLLRQYFSSAVYRSLVPVVGGVALASVNELEFNVYGFVFAVLSSVATAIQTCYSSRILTYRLDPVNLVYYMAPTAVLLLLPIAYVHEADAIRLASDRFETGALVSALVSSGVVAFLLNWSTFFAISQTSALSFNVAGNFKVVINIIVSVAIFRNPISPLSALGCAVALAGVYIYNQARRSEK